MSCAWWAFSHFVPAPLFSIMNSPDRASAPENIVINLKRNFWGLLRPQRNEIVIFFQNASYVDANIFAIPR